jgi:hypothetical protein
MVGGEFNVKNHADPIQPPGDNCVPEFLAGWKAYKHKGRQSKIVVLLM